MASASKHYSDPSLYPMQGGCPCGLLRYQIIQAPIVVHCCHCTSCQRETGTAFALNAFVESDQVEILPPVAPTVPGSISNPELKPAFPTPAEWTGPSNENGTVDPVYAIVPSESGDGVCQANCPRCLVCVWCYYGGGPGGVMKAMRVGTLDQAWQVEPDVHIFTRSKKPFISLQDGKPVYEGFYPDREWYRPDVKVRFEKVLAAIMKQREERKKAKEQADKNESGF